MVSCVAIGVAILSLKPAEMLIALPAIIGEGFVAVPANIQVFARDTRYPR